MLLKYSGISFISGAVNHGFFSGERSLWTAAIGIVLFVLGAALEHRLEGSQAGGPRSGSGLLRTLALGSLLSIGLGFFTGGLQHFPDSPARSAWVVPLGFFVSVLALFLSSTRDLATCPDGGFGGAGQLGLGYKLRSLAMARKPAARCDLRALAWRSHQR